MVYRIRHQSLRTLIILLLAFALCSFFQILILALPLPMVLLLCVAILQVFFIVMFTVIQMSKTAVTIASDTITVKHFFTQKRISIGEISHLYVERYKRWHKNHYIEKRLRLVILLNNGKQIKLNDTAMSNRGGLQTRLSRELQDEDIELYKVYQTISARMEADRI